MGWFSGKWKYETSMQTSEMCDTTDLYDKMKKKAALAKANNNLDAAGYLKEWTKIGTAQLSAFRTQGKNNYVDYLPTSYITNNSDGTNHYLEAYPVMLLRTYFYNINEYDKASDFYYYYDKHYYYFSDISSIITKKRYTQTKRILNILGVDVDEILDQLDKAKDSDDDSALEHMKDVYFLYGLCPNNVKGMDEYDAKEMSDTEEEYEANCKNLVKCDETYSATAHAVYNFFKKAADKGYVDPTKTVDIDETVSGDDGSYSIVTTKQLITNQYVVDEGAYTYVLEWQQAPEQIYTASTPIGNVGTYMKVAVDDNVNTLKVFEATVTKVDGSESKYTKDTVTDYASIKSEIGTDLYDIHIVGEVTASYYYTDSDSNTVSASAYSRISKNSALASILVNLGLNTSGELGSDVTVYSFDVTVPNYISGTYTDEETGNKYTYYSRLKEGTYYVDTSESTTTGKHVKGEGWVETTTDNWTTDETNIINASGYTEGLGITDSTSSNGSYMIVEKQISKTQVSCIVVKNTKSYIYSRTGLDPTQSTDVDISSRNFIIPLNTLMTDGLSIMEQTAVFGESMNLQIVAFQAYYLKWYQHGWIGGFIQIVMFIIILVITYVTWGSATPALLAGLTALEGTILVAVISCAVSLALNVISESISSPLLKAIVTVAVAIIGMMAGGGGSLTLNLPTAVSFCNMTINAINTYIGAKTQSVLEEISELEDTFTEMNNELNSLVNSRTTNSELSTWDITDIKVLEGSDSGSDTFSSGNVGTYMGLNTFTSIATTANLATEYVYNTYDDFYDFNKKFQLGEI